MPPRNASANGPAVVNAPSASGPAAGFVRLFAKPGTTHVSFDGEMYVISGGVVDVPQPAVQPLVAHGFSLDAPAADAIAPDAETSE